MKYFIGVVVGLALWLFGGSPSILSGVSSNSVDYANTVPEQITCNTTSTLLVATSTGRTSFQMTNVTGVEVFLCKGNEDCTATSGIVMAASSTFTQDDGYRGPYSCVGTAAGPVNIIHSQ